jgi:LPS-assembly lipoprotein
MNMRAIVLLLALVLSACGFQLRGSYNLPWETLSVNGLPENNELYFQIRRNIESSSQTRLVTNPKEAQAILQVLRDTQHKSILSLSAKGLVREFQLTRTFSYRIVDAAGKEIVPPSQIILQREMTFDDQQIFAKEAEEVLIVREMQTDLVQQLLRRLAAVKPKPTN